MLFQYIVKIMEKLSRSKLKGKENEKQWEYRQITLTCFASLWQCSCHYKGRCKRFSFKRLRVEHQQQFHRKAPLCIMREYTKAFCKENPTKQKNLQVFPDSMPLQGCSVSSVSNDGNCPVVMKISTWESYENSCKMQHILPRLSKWPTDTREIYIIRRAAHGFCY